ncbi:MAG: ribonuclease H-like domain-containing protein [Caldilineaceae bacterium]|nr:ribonuclease H-like domain-containing protein [Caldilineaceae bacterium]
MSSVLDRLRRLQSLRAQRSPVEPELPLAGHSAPGPLDVLVSGQEIENDGGRCWLVTERYPLETVRGHHSLHELLATSPRSIAPLYPKAGLDGDFDFTQTAFVDTETSGLGGGASVYAFMVGVGVFEGLGIGNWGSGIEDAVSNSQFPIPNSQSSFTVYQFFMRHPGEEAALLTALAELLGARSGLVTFNGRTFDAPLLRGRYQMNRRFLPGGVGLPAVLAEDAPHFDLLHPARRLWKRRLSSCSLGNLEAEILGLGRGEEDVPGSLIPWLYTQFLQTGNAADMRRVFYHNREDIVSMVSLAELLCRHFADPIPSVQAGELHPLDLASVGRVHAELGLVESAETAFAHALETLAGTGATGDLAGLPEIFDGLGWLLKRQERWDEAAALWQRWLTTVPGPDPRPYVELAKYCEWQCNDLEQAQMWTAWALHNQQTAPTRVRSPQAITELQHRLARIQRKQTGGDGSPDSHTPET